MTKLIAGLALLVLIGGGATGPQGRLWCAFYDASTYNCGFHSFEQAGKPCWEWADGAGQLGTVRADSEIARGNSSSPELFGVFATYRTINNELCFKGINAIGPLQRRHPDDGRPFPARPAGCFCTETRS